MNEERGSIAEDRPLGPDEREMLRWLLANADARGRSIATQVDAVHVVSRCGCGCASLGFRVEGEPGDGAGFEPISPERYWNGPRGGLCGIFANANRGRLAGLELWSVDGAETPDTLPPIVLLRISPDDAPAPAAR